MSNPIRITAVGQIAWAVKDLDAATAFYRDVMGLKFLFSAPPGLSFFDCGGVRLMLSSEESSGTSPDQTLLYFSTDDISGATAALEAGGAAIEQAPRAVADLGDRVLWLAVFRDSEGRLQHLMSEVPKGKE